MPFRPSLPCLKTSPSSRAWLARQFRDPYVRSRLSDPAAYRSRSAFKLLEIDQNYGSFLSQPHVNAVVDLGAAPGGWSQVVAGKLGWSGEPVHGSDDSSSHLVKALDTTEYDQKFSRRVVEDEMDGSKRPRRWMREARASQGSSRKDSDKDELDHYDPLNAEELLVTGHGTIIAVDLLNIQPIRGVHTLKADFLSPNTETLIQGLLNINGATANGGKVDIILSDMAANASGNSVRDTESSLEISHAVFEFARRNLRSAERIGKRRGGVLLLKHFMHPLLQRFRAEVLEPNFNDVKFIKPESSRSQSSEGYWLCQGWCG